MAVPAKGVRTAEPLVTFDPRPYAVALVLVGAALGIDTLIQPVFGIENVDLVFLTAVVTVAVRYGLLPSLLASVAASLCYNFFFLPPTFTFTIADPTNVVAFFFFMSRWPKASAARRSASPIRRMRRLLSPRRGN